MEVKTIPIQEKLDINGISTAITRREGSGPTLICIHGNSLSQAIFAPLWDEPALASYPVVTYDLPGHGISARSSHPGETYSFPGYASHLKSLVETLEVRKFIIIGHSLGGHIALQAALDLELTGLKGLFLMGTPPLGGPEDSPKAFLPLPEGASFFSGPMTEEGAEFLAEKLDSRIRLQESLKNLLLSTDPAARTGLMDSVGIFGLRNERQWIKESKKPVWLLFGENDSFINPNYINCPSFQKILGAQQKTKWLPQADHTPVWDSSPGHAEELLSFLKTIC